MAEEPLAPKALLSAPIGRENHPFAQAIWDFRIQATWIAYTGLYVIFGGYVTSHLRYPRWISSAFLTVAGVLVLLLTCHTVVAADRTASRKTLLVALTACLFFVQKSGDTFHDYNGVVFAVLFSLLLFILVWLPDESILRDKIKLSAISVLLAAIVFSAFELMAALGQEQIIRSRHLPRELAPISPHVSGILSGMTAFFLLDNYLVQQVNSIPLRPLSKKELYGRLFSAAIISVTITHIANLGRFDTDVFSPFPGLFFSAIYVFVLTGSAMVYVRSAHAFFINNSLVKAGILLATVIGSTVIVSVCQIAVQIISGHPQPALIPLCIYIYLLPSALMMVGSIISLLAFKSICVLIYEGPGQLNCIPTIGTSKSEVEQVIADTSASELEGADARPLASTQSPTIVSGRDRK